jgi:aminopeptidase
VTDPRIENLAKIIVHHSTSIQPGDRIALEATTAGLPLVRALYAEVLSAGGHPLPLLSLTDEDEMLFDYGNDEQLAFENPYRKLAYDEFESRVRIHSVVNTRALSNVPSEKQAVHAKSGSAILATQMRRGAAKEFKWLTTLFPTTAFAMEANMSLKEFEDFVYKACLADGSIEDPIAAWTQIRENQKQYIQGIQGHDTVELRGPNVDLSLSVAGRTFNNSHGKHNMPDGEIYTGPVEDSLNGWVRYTFPAITQGRVVEGVELRFENGRVVQATSKTNQDFLQKMIDSDEGAHYVGEFAIGTNYNIQQFTGNILFDEKIGGTFHMALGAGYLETGSKNTSMIHWDMICDLREDSEILVDGEVVYKDGKFTE